MVEHQLPKLNYASSILVTRSGAKPLPRQGTRRVWSTVAGCWDNEGDHGADWAPPATRGLTVDLFEFETTERLRREEAAGRLRQLADELERHNEVAVRSEGMVIKVRVPDEVTFEFEVELEDDESEIEVSIKW